MIDSIIHQIIGARNLFRIKSLDEALNATIHFTNENRNIVTIIGVLWGVTTFGIAAIWNMSSTSQLNHAQATIDRLETRIKNLSAEASELRVELSSARFEISTLKTDVPKDTAARLVDEMANTNAFDQFVAIRSKEAKLRRDERLKLVSIENKDSVLTSAGTLIFDDHMSWTNPAGSVTERMKYVYDFEDGRVIFITETDWGARYWNSYEIYSFVDNEATLIADISPYYIEPLNEFMELYSTYWVWGETGAAAKFYKCVYVFDIETFVFSHSYVIEPSDVILPNDEKDYCLFKPNRFNESSSP